MTEKFYYFAKYLKENGSPSGYLRVAYKQYEVGDIVYMDGKDSAGNIIPKLAEITREAVKNDLIWAEKEYGQLTDWQIYDREEVEGATKKRKARRTGYKRSNMEIDIDNGLIDKLLIHYYKLGKYVRLGTIIEYMQSQGRNWNEDNASNFMRIYIERTDKDAQRLAPGVFICTTSKKSKN